MFIIPKLHFLLKTMERLPLWPALWAWCSQLPGNAQVPLRQECEEGHTEGQRRRVGPRFLVVVAYISVLNSFRAKLTADSNAAAATALCFVHRKGRLRPLCDGEGNTEPSTWPRTQPTSSQPTLNWWRRLRRSDEKPVNINSHFIHRMLKKGGRSQNQGSVRQTHTITRRDGFPFMN